MPLLRPHRLDVLLFPHRPRRGDRRGASPKRRPSETTEANVTERCGRGRDHVGAGTEPTQLRFDLGSQKPRLLPSTTSRQPSSTRRSLRRGRTGSRPPARAVARRKESRSRSQTLGRGWPRSSFSPRGLGASASGRGEAASASASNCRSVEKLSWDDMNASSPPSSRARSRESSSTGARRFLRERVAALDEGSGSCCARRWTRSQSAGRVDQRLTSTCDPSVHAGSRRPYS